MTFITDAVALKLINVPIKKHWDTSVVRRFNGVSEMLLEFQHQVSNVANDFEIKLNNKCPDWRVHYDNQYRKECGKDPPAKKDVGPNRPPIDEFMDDASLESGEIRPVVNKPEDNIAETLKWELSEQKRKHEEEMDELQVQFREKVESYERKIHAMTKQSTEQVHSMDAKDEYQFNVAYQKLRKKVVDLEQHIRKMETNAKERETKLQEVESKASRYRNELKYVCDPTVHVNSEKSSIQIRKLEKQVKKQNMMIRWCQRQMDVYVSDIDNQRERYRSYCASTDQYILNEFNKHLDYL